MTPAEREVLSHYLSTLEAASDERAERPVSRTTQWRRDRAKSAAERQRDYRARKAGSCGEACVYIVRAGDTDLYKIGFSRDVSSRLDTLQTASPHKLSLVHIFDGADESIESALHDFFEERRSHGEWFFFGDELDPVEACAERIKDIRNEGEQ